MPKLLDKQVSFIDFPLWRFGTIGGMFWIYKKIRNNNNNKKTTTKKKTKDVGF